jgi:uncharacterized protein YceK
MARITLVLLALGSVAVSGCGTFSDSMYGPVNDQAYYRGVAFDVAAVKEGGPSVFMAADVPLSLVADTMLIPIIAGGQLTGSINP